MSAFENKRVIVTGASRGLGMVAAQAFAECGARVALVARSAEKLEEVRRGCREPDRHLSVAVDLASTSEITGAVRRASDFLGHVDAVIHVAGGGFGLRETWILPDDLTRLFAVNLGAVAEINRLVVPAMKERKAGYLVHVGSIACGEAIGSVGYNTVKAALAAYVRTIGRELAPFHVVASGIQPGGFQAPGNSMERLSQTSPEHYREFVEQRLPRRIMGDAKELLPMIYFLCSESASMMGGCMVPIDAGEGRYYTE